MYPVLCLAAHVLVSTCLLKALVCQNYCSKGKCLLGQRASLCLRYSLKHTYPLTDRVSFIISNTSLSSVHGKYQFGHTFNDLSTHYLQYLSFMYIHKRPLLFKFKVCGSKDVVSNRILCKGVFLIF